MVEQHVLRQRLIAAVQRSEDRIDLAEAALLIAQEHQPGFQTEDYLAKLDELAARAALRLRSGAGVEDRLEALHRVLFLEAGFTGNRAQYNDPRNSFLNEVLDRRTGIPITLAVVYLEVGWRLGLRLNGVGMPGHFLAVHHRNDGDTYLDPYNGGTELSLEDCRALVQRMSGGTLAFRPSYLRPVTKRQILSRMLSNLKAIYERAEDTTSLLAVLDQMIIVQPDSPVELRERGMLYQRYRAFTYAIIDLERFLELSPGSNQAGEVKRTLERIRRIWSN